MTLSEAEQAIHDYCREHGPQWAADLLVRFGRTDETETAIQRLFRNGLLYADDAMRACAS